jgi:hypothetical protein
MTTLVARAEWRPSRRFDVAASGGAKIFETEGDSGTYRSVEETGADPDRSETGTLSDGIANLSGRHRWATGSVGLRGMAEAGRRGHRFGGDLTTKQELDGGLYDALAVVSLYDWDDALRPTRSATSFSYVVGGGVRPFERTRIGVEWEHATNRLVGQRYRLLATLDLTVLQ